MPPEISSILAYPSIPDWVRASVDLFQKVAPGIAYLVGAFWIVMNYVRNRTHVPRLQVDVSAECVVQDSRRYLRVTSTAKNIGLSVIRLPPPRQEGLGPPGTTLLVDVLPREPVEPIFIEAPWNLDAAALGVFQRQRAIEPGLTISEQKLIPVPDLPYDACRVRLRVVTEGEQWSAVGVAMIPPKQGEVQAG